MIRKYENKIKVIKINVTVTNTKLWSL